MRKLRHDEIPRVDPATVRSLPRHPVSTLLDNIRSIHNVGSIFRTSDAAAIERIYCTGITGTPDHATIHRTALGAQDVVPWEYARDPRLLMTRLRTEGQTLVAVEITDRSTRVENLLSQHFPVCLVVGNEVEGISEELLAECDLALEVPQYGVKQSLNVAVAYGIVVFDVVRRYRNLQGNST